MNWTIKKYQDLTVNELYDILTLRNDIFIIEQQCIYQDCDGKDKHSDHIYLEIDGEIVAYLRVVHRGISYDEVSIGRVVVNRNHRGKDLGKAIMKKAIEYIEQELQETAIRISAQSYLLEFYKGFGFVPVSEEYMEDDIPHTEMLYLTNTAY